MTHYTDQGNALVPNPLPQRSSCYRMKTVAFQIYSTNLIVSVLFSSFCIFYIIT